MNGSDLLKQLPEAGKINDSSKMSDWQTCERYYLFQHLFGWRGEEPSIHLVFGGAAHKAKEHVRQNGGYWDDRVVDEAIDIFEAEYEKVYADPMEDEGNRPKNKDGFITALLEHVKRFREERKDWELLFTEVGFSVPINQEGDLYHGRIDAIFVIPDKGVVSIDDKFSSWDVDAWVEQWYLSFQMRGYLYALLTHCNSDNPIWQKEEVWGCIVDGMIIKGEVRLKKDGTPYANTRPLDYDELGNFYRHNHRVVEVPLRRDLLDIDSWLFEVNYHYSQLRRNLELLEESSESDPVLRCFPRRPKSCIQFGKPCKYFDFCHAEQNPLKLADNIPVGFKKEFWSPKQLETKHDVNKLKKEN